MPKPSIIVAELSVNWQGWERGRLVRIERQREHWFGDLERLRRRAAESSALASDGLTWSSHVKRSAEG